MKETWYIKETNIASAFPNREWVSVLLYVPQRTLQVFKMSLEALLSFLLTEELSSTSSFLSDFCFLFFFFSFLDFFECLSFFFFFFPECSYKKMFVNDIQ